MNNREILGEEAAVRQIVEDDFSATNGVFEDDSVTTLLTGSFRERFVSSVKLPNVETINSNVFLTSAVNTLYMPKLKNIVGSGHFSNAAFLGLIDIGNASTLMAGIGQQYVSAIILRKIDSIVTLGNVSYLSNTNYAVNSEGGAYVYVPRDLISSYQTATNWSTLYAAHSDMFRALENYTEDGTTTGDINIDKIRNYRTPDYILRNRMFDGTDYIDTGLKLFDNETDMSFIIAIDFTVTEWTNHARILQCATNPSNNSYGFWFGRHANNNNNAASRFRPPNTTQTSVNNAINLENGERLKIAFISDGLSMLESGRKKGASVFAPTKSKYTASGTLSAINNHLIIGAGMNASSEIVQNFKGIIHKLVVYKGNIKLSDAWMAFQ